MDKDRTDTSGTLDEALERLHHSGPERNDWLTNHAPMAVEALVRHGQAPTVHRWLDLYRDKLADMPGRSSPVTDANWQEALGNPRQLADWIRYFARRLDSSPWRHVLAEWWPRLLPGISAAATHGVIRTGHAVRTLLDAERSEGARSEGELAEQGPRLTELAHALGYWAARHQTLTGIRPLPPAASSAAGLAAVPRIADQSGGSRERLARIDALPGRPATAGTDAEQVRAGLTELVRAATHRYGTHAHGSPIMLVHAATAPNAVLRTLPALPTELWEASLDAAWSAATAITAAYTPAATAEAPPGSVHGLTPAECFARVAAHGDEHAIKLTDTALDVAAWDAGTAGAQQALAAAVRSMELIDPA